VSIKKLIPAMGIAIIVLNIAFSAIGNAATNNNLIDDGIFDNTNTMSAAQIDSFLNGFPNSCISTNSGFSAPDPTGYSPSTGYKYGNAVSAGKAIYDASQAYELNPQVLLTKLQNEEGLVRGDGPYGCGALPMSAALGYACTDSDTASHTYSYTNGSDPGTLSTPLFYRFGNPVNSVTNTCVNSVSKAGFTQQLIRASWLLKFGRMRSEGNTGWAIVKPNWDNSDDLSTCYGGPMTQGWFKRCPSETSTTYYDGYTSIDGQSIHMDTGATASLYWYTPHIQSFSSIFESWFGSTYSFTRNGINYSAVFDPSFYFANNTDVAKACNNDVACGFNHFITYGMNEGRQASANFNVQTYRLNYQDLRWAFGTNLVSYYLHYINFGQREGRVATGTPTFNPVTSYNGVNYASIYNYSTYMSSYSDLQKVFGSKNDDTGALLHFVNSGMNEGRVASPNFNVNYYRDRYPDLRAAFGNNLKAYYMHYLVNGQREGRIANTDAFVGTSVLNGVDYSAVYDFNTYESTYSDIKNAFGSDDNAALQHFVTFGMKEGRQASTTFNVFIYKNRYPDLQKAFGNNLPAYYMHYISYGKREGRIAI
jgi:hypothetical protein